MKAMAGEEMQQTANIGGALLEAFEGGGLTTQGEQDARPNTAGGGTQQPV